MVWIKKQIPPAVQNNIIPLKLKSGKLVYVTGPSGEGKSTLLSAIAIQARKAGLRIINADNILDPRLERKLLIDAIGDNCQTSLELLSQAGLGEIPLMLRRVNQLSTGQRMRMMLAKLMASNIDNKPIVIFFDEYASVLDRLTAKVVSRQLRKWVTRIGVCMIVATAHDDLLDMLKPDTLIHVNEGSYQIIEGEYHAT